MSILHGPAPLVFDVKRMALLDSDAVRFVFVHTQGSPGDTDSSVGSVHDYHKGPPNYWAGIGYHFFLRKDGSLEIGRDVRYQGAHVEGLNHCSIGICCSGHGNLSDFTAGQYATLAKTAATLLRTYRLPIGHLLGHNEVNGIPGVPRTDKSCPGRLVSMDRLRKLTSYELIQYPAPHIVRRDLTIPPLPHPLPFV